jgi:hypothetical protein
MAVAPSRAPLGLAPQDDNEHYNSNDTERDDIELQALLHNGKSPKDGMRHRANSQDSEEFVTYKTDMDRDEDEDDENDGQRDENDKNINRYHDDENAPLATPRRQRRNSRTSVLSLSTNSKPNSDDEKEQKGEQSNNQNGAKRHQVLWACIIQSLCSCSMVLMNKHLAWSYNHHFDAGDDLNLSLVVFQALVAVVSVSICKQLGWVERFPDLEWRTAKQWAPVNILFCGMLFSGMASLQHNTVPMVTVFKNVANIFITAG